MPLNTATGSMNYSLNVTEAVTHLPDTFLNIDIVNNLKKWTELVVQPVIGLSGLIGNAICSVVIFRSGLHKPSNIFLLTLAISDFLCLIHAVNVPYLLQYMKFRLPQDFGWEMPYWPALFCYYYSLSANTVSAVGSWMSSAITVAITFERLIAVYLPLRFTRLVTPLRAWIVVGGSILLSAPFPMINGICQFQFVHDGIPELDLWFGYPFYSDIWFNINTIFFPSYATVMNAIGQLLPFVLVSSGCVIISVKVTITIHKRKKLVSDSSKKKSTTQTTKTLLLVCVFYSITRATIFLNFLPQMNIGHHYWTNLGDLYAALSLLLNFINSAFNFVIYVVFNAKFRKITKDVIMCHSNHTKKSVYS